MLVPVIAVVILSLLPNSSNSLLVKRASILFSGILLIMSMLLYFFYNRVAGGMQFTESFLWVKYLGIHYSLGVDGLSIPLIILTALIGFTGVLVSQGLQVRVKEFFVYFFILMTGVLGVFMAQDLVMILIFLEVAVIPKFVLIQVWGSGNKEYSALKYTFYLLTGSILVLIAIMIFYVNAGTFDIEQLSKIVINPHLQKQLFLLLLLGFGVIVPIWPLHRWTPDGHSAAPTAISMMLAGVIMKLGAYALIRIGIGVLPVGAHYWAPVIAWIAAINCVYIALVAMVQKDLKYVIANSSISHMGYVLIGFAALNTVSLTGAATQLFAHGVMAALFFATVGLLYSKTHTRQISEMSGLVHQLPRIATIFLLTGLASLGLPGFINFIAEFLIFSGSFQVYPVLTILCILAIVFTAMYILHVFQRIFFGPSLKQWDSLQDANFTELIPLLILLGVMLILGIFPSLITDLFNSSIISFSQQLTNVKEAICLF